jgi:hypothetical protein
VTLKKLVKALVQIFSGWTIKPIWFLKLCCVVLDSWVGFYLPREVSQRAVWASQQTIQESDRLVQDVRSTSGPIHIKVGRRNQCSYWPLLNNHKTSDIPTEYVSGYRSPHYLIGRTSESICAREPNGISADVYSIITGLHMKVAGYLFVHREKRVNGKKL